MMTSDAKRALAKTIRELREKIILPDLREATERHRRRPTPEPPHGGEWIHWSQLTAEAWRR